MAFEADKTFMIQAIQLAKKGIGKTKPNPTVGAVLVKQNKVIGQGYHKGPGKDHAEIAAIKNASQSVSDSTLYVTLEPCCHSGRTGPCTDAIIKNNIKRVVVASKDPFSLVNGKGLRILRNAGIDVTTNVLHKEAFALNKAYFVYHKEKRPYVTLKLAQSLDGKIGTVDGDSKYLSSKESLKFVHQLRMQSDAVVIGGNTLRTDNPQLTVRMVKGENPYRIILSKKMDFSDKLFLIRNKDKKTIIASTDQAVKRFIKSKQSSNIIYWSLKSNGDKLDLHDLLAKAYEFEFQFLLFEGGGKLASSLLREKLVDKLILVITPYIIGKGIDSFCDYEIKNLQSKLSFTSYEYSKVGKDIIFEGYLKK